MFTATSRDVIPKATTNTNHATSAKRPRFGKRNSMIEKSPKARAPRFLSLDKGGCSCSKNSFSGNSASAVLPGSVSLLNSAPHWLSLIKLAEVERKHKVVIDLFRLAISLKAEVPFCSRCWLRDLHQCNPAEVLPNRFKIMNVIPYLISDCFTAAH